MAVKLINRIFNSVSELFIKNGNLRVEGNALAKVNNISNVYLGCPIGTVVMWIGQTAPDGWLLCNGDRILIKNSIPINQRIQGIDFKEGENGVHELQRIVNALTGEFGAGRVLFVSRGFYAKEATVDTVGKLITITKSTEDLKEARIFYIEPDGYTINDGQDDLGSGDYVFYTIRDLPNLQQKFPLGAMQDGTIGSDPDGNGYNTNLGKYGGEDTHILTWQEMRGHSHSGATATTTAHLAEGTNRVTGTPLGSGGGDSDPHNNIPPFLAINFIIKYQ